MRDGEEERNAVDSLDAPPSAFFIPVGTIGQLALAGFGAVMFSAYIVYDTFALLKRFSVDEYIWASVTLYLDVLNLFLRLLELIGFAQGRE